VIIKISPSALLDDSLYHQLMTLKLKKEVLYYAQIYMVFYLESIMECSHFTHSFRLVKFNIILKELLTLCIPNNLRIK